MLLGELTEAGTHRDVLATQATASSSGSVSVPISIGDHLVQRHPALERVLGRRVDLAVAELLDDHVQPVDLGDGAVPVQDDSGSRNER